MTHPYIYIYTSHSYVIEIKFPNILANQNYYKLKINKKRFENGGIPETTTQRTTNKNAYKRNQKSSVHGRSTGNNYQ